MKSVFTKVCAFMLVLGAATAFAGDKDRDSNHHRRGFDDGFRDKKHGGRSENPYNTPGGEKYERWERGYREGREAAKDRDWGRNHGRSYGGTHSGDYWSGYNGGGYSHGRPSHSPWPTYDNRYDSHYDRHVPTTTYSGTTTASCAPKTVNNNLAIADKEMAKLAATELRSNNTFKGVADDLTSLKNGQFKVNEYLRLVGVKNPNDANEVLNLLYGREIPARNIKHAADILNVSDAQAERVITSVKSSLRPR